MKKILALIIMFFILTGCSNDIQLESRIKAMASSIAEWHKNYLFIDESITNENDKKLLENWKNQENRLINLSIPLSHFVNDTTTLINTPGIFKQNNQTYIRYNDLVFESIIKEEEAPYYDNDSEEKTARIIYNGHEIEIYSELTPSLLDIQNNTLYTFIYKGIKKNDEFIDIYYSSLQDPNFVMQTRFTYTLNNIHSIDVVYGYTKLDLKPESELPEVNPFGTIILILIFAGLIGGGIYLVIKSIKARRV